MDKSEVHKKESTPIEGDYSVVTGWRDGSGSVWSWVEYKGQAITDEVPCGTRNGAVDYWYDQYYHGKVTRQ